MKHDMTEEAKTGPQYSVYDPSLNITVAQHTTADLSLECFQIMFTYELCIIILPNW
jgi:hypothetical protein